MVSTLKTAEELRKLMPQAQPERYIADINQKLHSAASAGKSKVIIYEGQCGLNDIGSTGALATSRTLAAGVARILQQNGYTVQFKPGYGDQRDYVQAHMIISW